MKKTILIIIALIILVGAAYVYFVDPGGWFQPFETGLVCTQDSDCILSYQGGGVPCTLDKYECISPDEAYRRDKAEGESVACAPCDNMEEIENFACLCQNGQCIKTTNGNSTPFVGERTVKLIEYPGKTCQDVCEETAGQPCYDYYQLCRDAGVSGEAGLLQACNEYFQNNPQVLEQYPCTYAPAQTFVGDDSMPCSFTCR
ncbi:MAG: hypothetical protein V1685_07230 [Parcubacteria group bacterium]